MTVVGGNISNQPPKNMVTGRLQCQSHRQLKNKTLIREYRCGEGLAARNTRPRRMRKKLTADLMEIFDFEDRFISVD